MMKKYFDNNATTPITDAVLLEMISAFSSFGNPSSSHAFGFDAKQKYKKAKSQIADLINCHVDDLILTSGGTESNNLGVKGYLSTLNINRGHIITTSIEHPSVIEVMKYLQRKFRFSVTFLKVNKEGIIDIKELESSIQNDTVLISVMMANNEIGSIQPIKEIGAIARKKNIFFHTDAVQAVGKLKIDVKDLGVDALSLSGHKFNAPKGIGALYLRSNYKIDPLIHGGGQEMGIRGGTENIVSAIGLGTACELLKYQMDANVQHYKSLKLYFVRRIQEELGNVVFNAGLSDERFLSNTVSLSIRGIRAEALSSLLSEKDNFAVSLGSACSANKKGNLSHVLTAIGMTAEEIRSTLRVSFGRQNTLEDVELLVKALKENTEFLRSFSTAELAAS